MKIAVASFGCPHGAVQSARVGDGKCLLRVDIVHILKLGVPVLKGVNVNPKDVRSLLDRVATLGLPQRGVARRACAGEEGEHSPDQTHCCGEAQ